MKDLLKMNQSLPFFPNYSICFELLAASCILPQAALRFRSIWYSPESCPPNGDRGGSAKFIVSVITPHMRLQS